MAPQNLVEFWAVATRPQSENGLGLTAEQAAKELAGIQDFYNRKGLFSDRGERKSAFFILRDYYKSMESK